MTQYCIQVIREVKCCIEIKQEMKQKEGHITSTKICSDTVNSMKAWRRRQDYFEDLSNRHRGHTANGAERTQSVCC